MPRTRYFWLAFVAAICSCPHAILAQTMGEAVDVSQDFQSSKQTYFLARAA